MGYLCWKSWWISGRSIKEPIISSSWWRVEMMNWKRKRRMMWKGKYEGRERRGELGKEK